MTWHDIANPDDPELDRLAAEYHIHPLHVEDCRHRDQRGKAEEGVGYEFVVLKPVQTTGDDLVFHDLDVFVGADWVITVQEGDPQTSGNLIQPIRAETSLTSGQILYQFFDAT